MGNESHRLQQHLEAGFSDIFESRRATAAAPSAPAWSPPYHGVQHLSAAHDSSIWVTVSAYPGFARCAVFTPGCGMRPRTTTHNTPDEARAFGERELARLTEAHS